MYPLWDAGLKVGHQVRSPEAAEAGDARGPADVHRRAHRPPYRRRPRLGGDLRGRMARRRAAPVPPRRARPVRARAPRLALPAPPRPEERRGRAARLRRAALDRDRVVGTAGPGARAPRGGGYLDAARPRTCSMPRPSTSRPRAGNCSGGTRRPAERRVGRRARCGRCGARTGGGGANRHRARPRAASDRWFASCRAT